MPDGTSLNKYAAKRLKELDDEAAGHQGAAIERQGAAQALRDALTKEEEDEKKRRAAAVDDRLKRRQKILDDAGRAPVK